MGQSREIRCITKRSQLVRRRRLDSRPRTMSTRGKGRFYINRIGDDVIPLFASRDPFGDATWLFRMKARRIELELGILPVGRLRIPPVSSRDDSRVGKQVGEPLLAT